MKYDEYVLRMYQPFPKLTSANSRPTSPIDAGYNCIAWAAGSSERWWWPDPPQQFYWPPEVPRIPTLDAFSQAFAQLGYVTRSDARVELGVQKVAVFADAQAIPTHAARQLSDGWWASKLGRDIDIEHELDAIEGPAYGKVALILATAVTPE